MDTSAGPRRKFQATSVAFDAARNRFAIVNGNLSGRQLAQVNQARKSLPRTCRVDPGNLRRTG
jgi:hypothetical protein